jgi:hypothetical protein
MTPKADWLAGIDGRLLRPSRLFAPTGDGEMKHFDDIYELYSLGRLHRLFSLEDDQLKVDQTYNLIQSFFVLQQFIEAPQNPLFLPASVKAARELRDTIDPIYKDSMAAKMGDDPAQAVAKFDLLEASGIKRRLTEFQTLLSHELGKLPVYIVERTGIYEVDDLINHADTHLLEATLQIVDNQVKDDFKAAGRCLAFDLFTACGFHSVRALEAMARIQYKKFTGKDAQEMEKPLGGIANDLRDIADDKGGNPRKPLPKDAPLRLLINNYDRMNNIYRKPLAHPEMILKTRDDARKVFELAAASISMIADLMS